MYNVLFIMPDDWVPDGMLWQSFGKTPHFNRLAKKAVRFDRAYNQYLFVAQEGLPS
jgi:arylsulfatase A-like enzyme